MHETNCRSGSRTSALTGWNEPVPVDSRRRAGWSAASYEPITESHGREAVLRQQLEAGRQVSLLDQAITEPRTELEGRQSQPCRWRRGSFTAGRLTRIKIGTGASFTTGPGPSADRAEAAAGVTGWRFGICNSSIDQRAQTSLSPPPPHFCKAASNLSV